MNSKIKFIFISNLFFATLVLYTSIEGLVYSFKEYEISFDLVFFIMPCLGMIISCVFGLNIRNAYLNLNDQKVRMQSFMFWFFLYFLLITGLLYICELMNIEKVPKSIALSLYFICFCLISKLHHSSGKFLIGETFKVTTTTFGVLCLILWQIIDEFLKVYKEIFNINLTGDSFGFDFLYILSPPLGCYFLYKVLSKKYCSDPVNLG